MAGNPHWLARIGIVLTGLVVPQVGLFYPSLSGARVLLPLDLLTQPNYYLPIDRDTPGPPALPSPAERGRGAGVRGKSSQGMPAPSPQPLSPEAGARGLEVHNPILSDPILLGEPMRQFAGAELRAGRLPLWNPYSFAGAPAATLPWLSPFFLLGCLTPSPVVLAWLQLVKSIVAGLGAYLFFRRALDVRFWPAAIGAWCYPLTGFYFLWLGYGLTHVAAWLPWTLWATDRAVRRLGGWGGPALALTTALVIVSGQLDLAGQLLLASGLYALWCLFDAYGGHVGPTLKAATVTTAGWLLGFLLAAPYLLPLLDYTSSGERMLRRQQGEEERPPLGLSAVPLLVVPNAYGSSQAGWLPLMDSNLLESPAAAFTGLLATLCLAPLAWSERRRRSLVIFLHFLALVALSWSLDLPGFVQMLRLPVLRMLSHNRFVFVTSFAVLTLAVIGLEQIHERLPARQLWYAIPVLLLASLIGWCGYRLVYYPERLTHMLAEFAPGDERAATFAWNYLRPHVEAVALGLVGIGFWVRCWRYAGERSRLLLLLALLWPAELLWFGHDLNPQCDPALYYPPVPALVQLGRVPDRVLGVGCLPPQLNVLCRLHDVRGYDAVDPARLVELLDQGRDRQQSAEVSYARTQWWVPRLGKGESLPALLNMLNVRYLLLRRPPAENVPVLLHRDDYWVLENRQALPRVFVPRRIEAAADPAARLQLLGAENFDPQAVAYVEQPLDVPAEARGDGAVVAELPTRLTVSARMKTPGLVVLADQWYSGWRARRDGVDLPVHRVNHALRGVVLPAGESTVVFEYWPAALSRGFACLGLSAAAWLGWALLLLRRPLPAAGGEC